MKGLAKNTSYYWSVQTIDTGLRASEWSSEQIAYTAVTEAGPPAAPSGFTGTSTCTTSIEWSWRDVTNEEGYRVKEAESGEQRAELEANTTYWVETGLSPNTSYYRYVEAYNITGASSSTPKRVYTLASVPWGLHSPTHTTSSITLKWQGKSTRYRIEKSLDGETYGHVVDVEMSLMELSWTQTGLYANTDYWYQVSAYNGDGILSKPCDPIWVKTTDDTTPPGKITGVKANDNPSDTGGVIIVSWNLGPEEDIAQYKVYYAQDSFDNIGVESDYVVWVGTSPTPTQEVGGLEAGQPYYFAVMAVDTSGNFNPDVDCVGPVYAVNNAIDTEFSEATIQSDFDPAVVAIIPQGTNNGINLSITRPDLKKEGDIGLADGKITWDMLGLELLGDSLVEFKSDQGLAGMIEITLRYPEEVKDPNSLRVYVLDETNDRWVLIEDEPHIDWESRTAKVSVDGSEWGMGKVYRLFVSRVEEKVSEPVLKIGRNIFSPTKGEWCNIIFGLPKAAEVVIRIYDICGDLVWENWVGWKEAGWDGVEWYGRNNEDSWVASDLYFVVVRADDKVIDRQPVQVIK